MLRAEQRELEIPPRHPAEILDEFLLKFARNHPNNPYINLGENGENYFFSIITSRGDEAKEEFRYGFFWIEGRTAMDFLLNDPPASLLRLSAFDES